MKIRQSPASLLLSTILFLLLAGGWQVQGQNRGTLSERARISLLTISPGEELYSTFGHSAIRVVDTDRDLDIVFNYGTFDFNQPGFYMRFVRGQLDYSLSAYRYIYAYEQMRLEQRSIIEQHLNLNQEQLQKLFSFLRWNSLPENRNYRYDFFFDNCATRIRDVFERTLADELSLNYEFDPRLTFRELLDQYLGDHPWSDLGIDLGLGAKADRRASPRETLFLPDYLFRAVANGQIVQGGIEQPFVIATDTLLWYPTAIATQVSSNWVDLLFVFLLVIVMFISIRQLTGRWAVPPKLVWVDYFLYGVSGLLGVLIAFLWWGTDHNVTQNNWNLLWAWPTHFLAIIFVGNRHRSDWMRAYFILAAISNIILAFVYLFGFQKLHFGAVVFSIMLFWRHLVNMVRRTVS